MAQLNDAPDTEAQDGETIAAKPRAGGLWAHAVALLAAALSIFHLITAVSPIVGEFTRNALHFGGFALLVAMTAPMFDSSKWLTHSLPARLLDLTFGLLALAASIYVAATIVEVDQAAEFSAITWVAAFIVLIAALELTRRTSGPVIPILALLGFTFVFWWGPYAPQPFTFRGLSMESAMRAVLYEDEGMFGTLARISSTVIFLFIIFGAFLVRSGAGEFVIAVSRAVAGRMVGGPGLIAVISSALTGTISGSAVANTASTGVITIPLMKRAGYGPSFSAAVEASASTGGQLMPPIMGAGAFLMASYAEIPYETIIAVAALPALLYFASVAMFVRIEARRLNLTALADDGPTFGEALRDRGASFIIPIATIITLLVVGYSPAYSAVIGVFSVIASSWLTKTPMGLRAIWEALVLGARNMGFMAVLLCAIGVFVSAIGKASIGQTFSLMIAEWSGGDVLVAIVLIAIASLILGMGLPVTAAYIVLATLSAPMLRDLIIDASGAVPAALAAGDFSGELLAGVALTMPQFLDPTLQIDIPTAAAAYDALGPFEKAQIRPHAVDPSAYLAALLSAHMIVFWLSQDSNVTPPVCLAAFTAAAIAKSPPMRTGFESWKIAKGLYIVPILFATTPFLSGDFTVAVSIFGLALIGVYGLAGALSGAMETKISLLERVLAGIAGVACLWHGPLSLPGVHVGIDHLIVNSLGAALVIGILLLSVRRLKTVA